jgi:hypothetical protein
MHDDARRKNPGEANKRNVAMVATRPPLKRQQITNIDERRRRAKALVKSLGPSIVEEECRRTSVTREVCKGG